MFGFNKVIRRTAFTSGAINEINILENYLFCLNSDGMIVQTVSPDEEIYQQIIESYQDTDKFQQIPDNHYLLPGFIELHVHALSGNKLVLPLINHFTNS